MRFLKLVTDYMSGGVLLFGILGAIFPEFFAQFKALTPYLLGFVMFGMGLGLSFHDFFNVALKPKTVLFGIVLQFLLMPLIAYTLASVFKIPLEFAVGFFLVGCCPGGTASNVLTYLAKGNVALSVSMTICTTLLSPFVTPAIFYLMAHNSIEIDFIAMMLNILKMVVAPVFFGVLVNALLSKVAKKIYIFMPFISSLTIMVIVAIVVSLSGKQLNMLFTNEDYGHNIAALILIAIILHNAIGCILAYFIARIFKFSHCDSRTIAIEVGTQNSGLGAVLAMQHLTALAAIVAAIFSIVQNIFGSIFGAICLKFTKEEAPKKDIEKQAITQQ